MASLGAPRTPAFVLLALAAATAAAAHATVVALLPFLAAPDAPATALALALLAFHLPALALHPLLHAAPPRRPRAALAAGLALDAAAAALFLRAAAVAPLENVVPAAPPPASLAAAALAALPRTLAAAMLCAGAAAALFQDQLIRHVSASLPPAHFHRHLGVHLSVIEAAATSFAAAAPLLAAALLALGAPLPLPFVALATLTLAVLPPTARALLLEPAKRPPTLAGLDAAQLPPPPPPPAGADAGPATPPSAPALRVVLAQPGTALPLLAMVFAIASVAFLRPLLAIHVIADLHRAPLFSAAAFATVHVCILATNNVATAVCAHTGRRPVIIAGLAVAALGFRALAVSSWTLTSVAVLAVGANSALVLTLGDVAEASDVDVSGRQGDAVALVSFMAMASGEVVGILCGGLLQDQLGSFDAAVHSWSSVLAAVVVVLLVPEAIDVWRSFFGRRSAEFDVTAARSAHATLARLTASPTETAPLLAARH